MSAELSVLFIEQTKKVAALAASLGLHGDLPAEELAKAGRRMVAERRQLVADLATLRTEAERREAGLEPLRLGAFGLRRLGRGKIFITYRSGEGMETDEAKLEAVLQKFWDEEF